MPTTEVILTEKIASLGAEADVVKVKRGYARNYLVPSGKALEVTPVTLRRINQLKAKRAEREGRDVSAPLEQEDGECSSKHPLPADPIPATLRSLHARLTLRREIRSPPRNSNRWRRRQVARQRRLF